MIGLIKVVPAPKFRSDWSYKSQIRKNDLLQIMCFEPETKPKNFFLQIHPEIEEFSSEKFTSEKFSSDWSYSSHSRTIFFRVIGLIATHDSGLIATHVSSLITTSPVNLHFCRGNGRQGGRRGAFGSR